MQQAQSDRQQPFPLGDRVRVVGTDAQTAAGGTQGTVVGHTDADPSGATDPKIIVAIDAGPATKAVLDPTDLRRHDDPASGR